MKFEGKCLPKYFKLTIEEHFEIFFNYIHQDQKDENKKVQDLIMSLIKGGYDSIEGSYNFNFYLFSEILNFEPCSIKDTIVLFLNKQQFKDIVKESKSKLIFDKQKIEQSLNNFTRKYNNLQAFFGENKDIIKVFDAYIIYYYLKNDLQKCKEYIEHFGRIQEFFSILMIHKDIFKGFSDEIYILLLEKAQTYEHLIYILNNCNDFFYILLNQSQQINNLLHGKKLNITKFIEENKNAHNYSLFFQFYFEKKERNKYKNIHCKEALKFILKKILSGNNFDSLNKLNELKVIFLGIGKNITKYEKKVNEICSSYHNLGFSLIHDSLITGEEFSQFIANDFTYLCLPQFGKNTDDCQFIYPQKKREISNKECKILVKALYTFLEQNNLCFSQKFIESLYNYSEKSLQMITQKIIEKINSFKTNNNNQFFIDFLTQVFKFYNIKSKQDEIEKIMNCINSTMSHPTICLVYSEIFNEVKLNNYISNKISFFIKSMFNNNPEESISLIPNIQNEAIRLSIISIYNKYILTMNS